jgi:anti-sigma-K factor RskA
MIPTDREELDVLAGEYVLGVLDPAEAQEVAAALATHPTLQDAVTFWEQQLHPLSALAPAADPPREVWDAIAARLKGAATPQNASQRWKDAAPWRWATAGFASAAAALLLYIALTPAAAPLVAVLHAPQSQAATWIATVGRDGLRLSAITRQAPPRARAYELWGIAGGSAHPEPLGVIASNATLRVKRLPRDIGKGAMLAISVEPPGGSPTGLPTGPVVFVGTLQTI